MGHVVQQTVFVHVVHATNGALGRCCFAVVTFGLQLSFGIGQGFVLGFTSDFIGGIRLCHVLALIGERDAQAFIQKRHLLETSAER